MVGTSSRRPVRGPSAALEPMGRDHKFVGDRFQQQFGLAGDPGELGLDTGRGDGFLRLASHELAPWPTEATA